MAAAHLRIDFRAFLPSAFGADSCGESKRFFFEKKNQKTFVHWASAFGWRGSQYPKVFCFFFSKKKVFLAGLNRSASRALGIMPGGFESDSREEGKQFFFEKNNEKTFVHGASAFGWRGSQYAKVFCLFFLKKKAFLPGLNRSVSSAAVTGTAGSTNPTTRRLPTLESSSCGSGLPRRQAAARNDGTAS